MQNKSNISLPLLYRYTIYFKRDVIHNKCYEDCMLRMHIAYGAGVVYLHVNINHLHNITFIINENIIGAPKFEYLWCY